MRPNHLERYFKQQRPTLGFETKECFSSKAKSLKRMRLDGLHLKASFEIAFLIAKQKKLHTIGKTMYPKSHADNNFRRRCRAKNEVYFSFE
nr:unnamed protein product [Callosobruchus analis]